MNSWFKISEITTGSSKYFSRLNLYYNDNGEEIRIEDDLNFEIDGFNCSFYYSLFTFRVVEHFGLSIKILSIPRFQR